MIELNTGNSPDLDLYQERQQRRAEKAKQRNRNIVWFLATLALIGVAAGLAHYVAQTVLPPKLPLQPITFKAALLHGCGSSVAVGVGLFWATLLGFVQFSFNRYTMEEIPGTIPRNPYRVAAIIATGAAVVFASLLPAVPYQKEDVFWPALLGALLASGLTAVAAFLMKRIVFGVNA